VIRVERDDLSSDAVIALLDEHLSEMHEVTPDPASVHALDLDALRAREIEFWAAWEDGVLLGCGALKRLSGDDAEIKSMRSARNSRGRGVGQAVLTTLLASARAGGYRRVLLETGSSDFYRPAQRLYQRNGFVLRGPFASYREDPNSVFMELTLS
jgi:putative acetyltransferase